MNSGSPAAGDDGDVSSSSTREESVEEPNITSGDGHHHPHHPLHQEHEPALFSPEELDRL